MAGSLSKNKVKKAGEVLANSKTISEPGCSEALLVVNQWREAHQELIAAVPAELKEIAFKVDPEAVVVGRIKRIDTIVGKLRRPGLNMKLNEMCDIAGCRVIVDDIRSARRISDEIGRAFSVKPDTGVKDYIVKPKPNGYRSTHIISRHDAPESGFTNLFCETQVRTRLQHAWATALETYDVISRGSLKFGGGSDEEKRLFALISNAFAMKEGAALVPGLPSLLKDVQEEVVRLNGALFAIEKLRACSGSVTMVSQEGYFSGDAFCLLAIDYELQKTDLFVYDTKDEVEANQMYAKREKAKRGLQDVLLVRVSSLQALEKAYPNYSTDIKFFLGRVSELFGI